MAKIEIFARPVKNFEIMGKYAPQHLYIVHTKDNGEQIAYRGGPEKGNYHKDIKGNEFRDNLKVSKMAYVWGHPDYPIEGTSHPKRLSIEGNDQLINPYIEKMESGPMKWINDGNFDYKVLIGQNSNSAVRKLIEGVGLEFGLPKYEDGRLLKIWKEVIAPEWGAKIEHTWIDKTGVGEKAWEFYDKLKEKLDELNKKYSEKVAQVKKDIAEKMGIEMKELDEKLEEALKLSEAASLASKLSAGSGDNNKLFPKTSICMPFTDTYKSDIKDSFNNIKKSLLKTINDLLIEKKDKQEGLEKELSEKLDKLQKELDENIEKEREDTEDKLKAENEKYLKELNENIANIKDKYKEKMVDLSKITKDEREQIKNALKYDLDDIYDKYKKKILNYEDLLSKFENAVYKDIERTKEYYASKDDVNKIYSSIQDEERSELENKINDICSKYTDNTAENSANLYTLFYNLCISHKNLMQADSNLQLTKFHVFSIVNEEMINQSIHKNKELYKNELSEFIKSFKVSNPNVNITEKMKEFIKALEEKSKEISKHLNVSLKDKLLQENKPSFVSAAEKVKDAREASKDVYNKNLVDLYKKEEEKYLAITSSFNKNKILQS